MSKAKDLSPLFPAQLPALGLIVHYRGMPEEAYGGQDWHPAIVTGVLIDPAGAALDLKVIFRNGPVIDRSAVPPEGTAGAQRVWRWPPRV